MTLAGIHLDRADSPLAAYNTLQIALMRRFVAMGGTAELWCDRLAPAFRRRYGWMLGRDGPARWTARSRRDV